MDPLNTTGEQIVDSTLALLNEHNGTLEPKQREVILVILANAEHLLHCYAEFQSVPLHLVTREMRHELGNPLTPIVGYSDLLAAGMMGQLNDIQLGYVRRICDATDQLRALIEARVAEARRGVACAS